MHTKQHQEVNGLHTPKQIQKYTNVHTNKRYKSVYINCVHASTNTYKGVQMKKTRHKQKKYKQIYYSFYIQTSNIATHINEYIQKCQH